MEKKFKPFDKVIVKSHYDHCWKPDFFCYKIEGKGIQTIGGFYNEENVLPYEGHEHLVGTSDSPDEEVKLEEGEYCIFFDNLEKLGNGISGVLRRLQKINGIWFLDYNNLNWDFAIHVKDFDPSNMEETKKHILCVKNGKVIRYKG